MSTFITEILDNVKASAETLNLYASIVYGSDPPMNGICMITNGGFALEEHLNAGQLYELPILINGKHYEQQTVLETLISIHELLTKTLDYYSLSTDDAQVISISTTSAPAVIGREQNNQWIVGSSVVVHFYWR